MPRVTDAHRQARRDQIAQAALRVVGRHGVADTSMALIAEECGLSIGAIYVNFENKAELARYVATRLLGWRTESLERLSASGRVVTPVEVLRHLLGLLADDRLPPGAVLQFWSRATVEVDLHTVMAEQVERLRATVADVLGPWAGQQDHTDPQLARRTSQALLMACQGFLANRALYGWLDADAYADALVDGLVGGLVSPPAGRRPVAPAAAAASRS